MKISALASWRNSVVPAVDGALSPCRCTRPTETFWAFWRTFKQEMADAGVELWKENGNFFCSWWPNDLGAFDDPDLTKKAGAPKREVYLRSVAPFPIIAPENLEKLLPYQRKHSQTLVRAVHRYGGALDASDTGTGKTFCAAITAKTIGLVPFVVCAKAAIPMWKRTLDSLDVGYFDVLNYEKIRYGNTPYGTWKTDDVFEWNSDLATAQPVFVFDEIHRCKGQETKNAAMLVAARRQCLPTLGLSATSAHSPLEMRALGYLLGLHQLRGFNAWAKDHGVIFNGGAYIFPSNNAASAALQKLHSEIFPERGSRIRISELGDLFPETQITAEAYDIGDKNRDALTEYYREALKTLEIERDQATSELTVRLKCRQIAELLRVPTLADLTTEFLELGHSVVIFTCFRDTVRALSGALKTSCLVVGGQDATDREKNIAAFQADRERVLIANIGAGSESISLHDLNAKHSRVALVCPTDSAVQLRQALGRVHRAGAKTKSLQRIVFAAGTIEERVCENVKKKLHNIDLLNDGDLSVLPL